MAIGTVKWSNPAKGHGFIKPDDGGPDVLVHFRADAEDTKIIYELKAGRSGTTPPKMLQKNSQKHSSDARPFIARKGCKRRARRKAVGTRAPILIEARPNLRWSLDFVHDQFANGHRRFRILNIVDDVTRRSRGGAWPAN